MAAGWVRGAGTGSQVWSVTVVREAGPVDAEGSRPSQQQFAEEMGQAPRGRCCGVTKA